MYIFNVVEKFVSINGEGTRAGELAVFIRFRKCNLNCSFCDTRWANSENAPAQQLTADEILLYVKKSGIKNVTLTGGEPLLQENIAYLINELGRNGFTVEIETNGSIPLKEFAELEYRPYFTMDYKLPVSGMEGNMCCENFAYLTKEDTVKFVVGDIHDLERAVEVMRGYNVKCYVYLSPVFGKIQPSEIVEFMKENKLNNVRLQLQLHKYIWNPEKRGV
jgi:7-carboxy-7-deazaguanine synthase